MLIFYKAVLESLIRYGITAWFGNLSVQLRNKLSRPIHTAGKIIGTKERWCVAAAWAMAQNKFLTMWDNKFILILILILTMTGPGWCEQWGIKSCPPSPPWPHWCWESGSSSAASCWSWRSAWCSTRTSPLGDWSKIGGQVSCSFVLLLHSSASKMDMAQAMATCSSSCVACCGC